MEDGLTCADIDECESPGVCSQLCYNTPGSYQCDCHPGYIIEADGRQCKITGKVLLADNKHEKAIQYLERKHYRNKVKLWGFFI